ncbi:MAG TPA: bifunctional phosphopantothenoylcysteine decarboxylase/phosphopantothenate--cysteine ligase CoaBC [Burkholderiales bacterium]|nr:bifunctional phosphopantothenoylcysteine decarboxylase/phosphopantothenate--cysteine ligase CoaBC [Burkholderiales bacterium]
MADQRKIVLGVTGGIAAYKAAELARLLIKDGAEVQVVMTEAATGFIAPATFQALTGRPVLTDMWDAGVPNRMAHIELTRGADAVVVAPATADFIAKLAHGAADDLLSALCLARPAGCPLLVAPAMNREMWDNAATRRNVAQLERDGIVLLGPASGDQACGETGFGRMLEPGQIHQEVAAHLSPPLLAGKHVLVTAGPTYEAIDAVRGITNRSSGKMGYAVARAALAAGARVTLISGPVALTAPAAARVEPATSADEMFAAVKKHLKDADIFISVAAVADYRPEQSVGGKIKKSGQALNLKLVPTPDIVAWAAAQPDAPFCVGFAAETEKLHEHAQQKRRDKKLPLLAANLAQSALGADDNELVLFDDRGAHKLARAPKSMIARQLIAHIAALMNAGTRHSGTAARGEQQRLH